MSAHWLERLALNARVAVVELTAADCAAMRAAWLADIAAERERCYLLAREWSGDAAAAIRTGHADAGNGPPRDERDARGSGPQEDNETPHKPTSRTKGRK